MKWIVLASLLFVSTSVIAKPYLIYHYSSNTRIVMTNESCLVKGLEGHRAVVQRTDGAYIQGCWRLVDADQHVRIDWNNPNAPGDFSVLPFELFRVEDDGI
jgi:carbohydrate-binding DOMON domain-containing protein